VDDSYRASIIATSKDGLAVPGKIVWHKGKLYLADESHQAIDVWSKESGLTTFCDSSIGIASPKNMALDQSDSIFLTGDCSGGVWQIDPRGKANLLAGKDKGLLCAQGIVLSPEGNILVGDGEQHEIFSVTRQGVVSVFLGPEYGIAKPESMAFDERGNLYIADNRNKIIYLFDTNRIIHVLIDGRNTAILPETIFYYDGALYMTDGQAGKVYRYSLKDGLKTIAIFGGKLKNVHGITVDADGNIYVTAQSDAKRKAGYIIKLTKYAAAV
jgi:sugar lactone lactonase YvrE